MPPLPAFNPPGSPRAFTLLELLTVVAIIAVLAALALGVGRRASAAGRGARAKAELAVLAVALEDYRRIHGEYPPTGDAAILLQSLIGRRDAANRAVATRSLIDLARFATEQARDPFTDSTAVLVDPWGQPYCYAYKTQSLWSNSSYVLYSIGPDGRDSSGLLTGGLPDPAPPENADNLHANRP